MNWCSTHGVNFKREKTCSLCTRDMRNEALREAAVIADDYSYEAAVAILAKLSEPYVWKPGEPMQQRPNPSPGLSQAEMMTVTAIPDPLHRTMVAGHPWSSLPSGQTANEKPECWCRDDVRNTLCPVHRAAQQVTSAPAEQPTRHFSAKQIQDVFESYWSGTSSMSTKAAQFVADKLNTLLDAPAEQRLRELTEDEVMSAINYWRGYNGTLTGATAMLNALVKKYGERG